MGNKFLWHSSAIFYLIKIRSFNIIAPLLSKDNNFIDKQTEMLIKADSVVSYYSVDSSEIDDNSFNRHKGGIFGKDPDSVFVFLKTIQKDYKVVVSYPPVMGTYKQKLGNKYLTVFDVIKNLYDNKQLSKSKICDIMHNHQECFKSNPPAVNTIKAYKELHNEYLKNNYRL